MLKSLLKSMMLAGLWLSFQVPLQAQKIRQPLDTTPPGSNGLRNLLNCATPNLNDEQRSVFELEMSRALQMKQANGQALAGITWVPIKLHVMRRSDGTGAPSLSALNNILAITNSYHVQNGTGIQFYYAGTTIDYIDNTTWYNNFTQNIESSVANGRDATNALNLYIANYSDEGWGGYARYPQNNIVTSRVFLQLGALEGEEDLAHRVLPHELGHTFSLIHTFGDNNGTSVSTELVTRGAGANCTSAGDLLCDTPADPYGRAGNSVIDVNGCDSYNGTATDANGERFNPIISNLMSYYFPCTHEFVPGQYQRMQAGLALRQSHTVYSLTYPSTNVPAAGNVSATFNAATSMVTVKWQDNATNELGYFIERSTSPTSGFVTIGGVGPNVTTFTDTKSGATTAYYYRVRPSNSTSGVSPTASVTTACLAPNDLKTINVTGTTAKLLWLESGPGITYQLQWRKNGTTSWTTVSNITTPGYTLSGLVAGNTYEWQVRNKCTSGVSAYTSPVTFSTTNTECAPPPGIGTFKVTTNSAQLLWNTSGAGVTYDLQWKAASAALWNNVSGITSTSYSLAGLNQGTTYDWRVKRNCGGGTYSSFISTSFNTLSPNCKPSYVYGCLDLIAFNTVSLNGVTLSNNSGCSPDGYRAFPGSTSVAPGQTVPFSGTFLSPQYSNGVSVWMDANRNGMYEENERVFYTPSLVMGSVSGNIKIPVVTPGSLSMRVSVAYGTTPANSCGIYNYGETEDYVLNVTGSAVVCTPSYVYGCSQGVGLDKVVVNGVTLSQGSGCSPNGYAALAGTTTVKSGQIVSISGDKLNNSYAVGLAVWLDANRNNIFEANEIAFSTPQAAPGAFSGNITIPASLTAGPLKMRIVSVYDMVPANSCGSYPHGETEDYTLTVESATCTVAIAGAATLSCSQPSLTLTASTSSPNPTYKWSTGATTAAINVTTAGTYTVTMTSAGCTATASKVITGSTAAPTVAITSPATALTCNTKTIKLTAATSAPNPTYKWSTGATTAAIDVTTAGTYTVTMTSAGCTATASKVITGSTAAPTVAITSPATALTCNNKTIKLTAATSAPNPTYKWSTGATTAAIDVTTAGTYTVTMTSAGCTATASKVITGSAAAPTVAITSPATALTCNTKTIKLTAATSAPNPTYKWSTGATTAAIDVTTAGTYTVTMTSAGCTATASKVITGSTAAPTVSITSPATALTCNTKTIKLTAATSAPNPTYKWSTGATTAAIDVTTAGTYTVTMTSAGCTATASKVITGSTAAPMVAITSPATALTCNTKTIKLTAATSAPNPTYKWSTGATTAAIDVTTAGTYTVTMTSAGCTATASKVITGSTAAPTVSITSPATALSCDIKTIKLTAATTAPNPTYKWSTGATTAAIDVTTAGTYTVTMTSAGCTATASKVITGSTAAPTVAITSPATALTCNTKTIKLTAATSAPNPTYKWSTGATTAAIDVTTAGTYTVTMTSATCTATASKVITGSTAAPTVSIAGATALSCSQPNVTLTASTSSASPTYKWSTGATTAAINVTAAGTYTVTMTSGGCKATASKVVTGSGNSPVVTVSGDTALTCAKPSVKLTAATAAPNPTYKWSTGATTAAISITTAGSYTVTMKSGTCTTTVTKVVTGITVPPTVNITSPSGVLSCTRTEIRLTASTTAPNPTYKWSTGETTAQIYVKTAGTYKVTVTGGGCTATFSKTITGGCTSARIAAEETEMENIPLELTVYPNPVHEKLQAEISSNGKNPVSLRLVNMKGLIVTQKDLEPFYGKQKVDISLDRFTIGLYFLEITSGNEKTYKRIMVN